MARKPIFSGAHSYQVKYATQGRFADKIALSEEKKQAGSWHNTALIVEALVVLAIVVACMAVFVRLFSYAYTSNIEDSHRAHAITLASNQAEVFAADAQAVRSGEYEDADGYLTAIAVTAERTDRGTLYHATITVSLQGDQLYSLTTANYVRSGE